MWDIFQSTDPTLQFCKSIYKESTINCWNQFADQSPCSGEDDNMVAQRRFWAPLALFGENIIIGGSTGPYNPLPENEFKKVVVNCNGHVYGINLRSICKVLSQLNQQEPIYSLFRSTNADAMCVGSTLFISTLEGVEAVTPNNHFQFVTNNRRVCLMSKLCVVSPLSSHDPEAQFGSMIVFKPSICAPHSVCFLYIVDETVAVKATRLLGIASACYTSTAISKDGDIVCIECFDENKSTITVYSVTYGINVFLSNICEIGKFDCNRQSKYPCKDILICGDFIIAVESCGRMKGWHKRLCRFEWEFGGGCQKPKAIDDIATSNGKIIARSGNYITLFSVPALG